MSRMDHAQMMDYARMIADKAAALKRGERIVVQSRELNELELLVDDIRTLPTQDVVAYCDSYYAQLKPFPIEMVRKLSPCAMR